MTVIQDMERLRTSQGFDSKDFIESVGKYEGFERFYTKSIEDFSNPQILQTLGEILGHPETGEPTPELFMSSNPQTARRSLDGEFDRYTKRLINYTDKNLGSILDEMSGKGQLSLLSKIPLKKTGDASLDTIVNDLTEFSLVNRINSIRDGEKDETGKEINKNDEQIKYILGRYAKRLKEIGDDESREEEERFLIERRQDFIINATTDRPFLETAFNAYVTHYKDKKEKAFEEGEKINVGKTRKVIEASINGLRQEYESETDEAKKNMKLGMLRGTYLQIAKGLRGDKHIQEYQEQNSNAN